MTGGHGLFILASYGITALVIGGLILATIADHRSLRRMLAKFPEREDGRSGDE